MKKEHGSECSVSFSRDLWSFDKMLKCFQFRVMRNSAIVLGNMFKQLGKTVKTKTTTTTTSSFCGLL